MRLVFYILLGILIVPAMCFAGDIQTDGKFKSTLEREPPLEVASTSMVANLNADMVDGVEGTNLYTKTEVDALVAAAVESAGARQYYLTDIDSYYSDAAIGACASGFHMANLFEIADPSNLSYGYSLTDAHTTADSATGPPTQRSGWVRTGYEARTDDAPGVGNCSNWVSTSASDYGTVAYISAEWTDPSRGGSIAVVSGTPWASFAQECNLGARVWCIED